MQIRLDISPARRTPVLSKRIDYIQGPPVNDRNDLASFIPTGTERFSPVRHDHAIHRARVDGIGLSRQLYLGHDLLAELLKRALQRPDLGLMIEVEHAPNLVLRLAELFRQRDVVQAVLAHSLV